MSGTLNGSPLLRAALTVPRWGIWTADVVAATGEAIAPGTRVELVIGGATYSGTVRYGGAYREATRYRIVGGADGWSRELLDRSYQSALEVRRSNVLADAARECGETLGNLGEDVRVGPAFVRHRGEASLVLDAVAPEAWYVDEAGVTQLGARPAQAFALPYVVADSAPDRGLVTVQAESIVGLVPGAQLEGIEAASVRHELTGGGLRSHIWGTRAATSERLLGALRSLVAWLTRETWFHRLVEYRVVGVSSGFVDLRPVRSSVGAPALASVPLGFGVPGAAADPQTGSTCLVAFVDGDPTRPRVISYEGPSGAAHIPEVLELDADEMTIGGSESSPTTATGRFIRYGDPLTFSAPGPGFALAPTPFLCSKVRG